MADIFTKSDAVRLLSKKTIWFFGDSNIRGLYKDLLWLLTKNTLIDLSSLRAKLEKSFLNDKLMKGETLHRGRDYQEIRQYRNFEHHTEIEFTFITHCYSDYIENKLKEVWKKKEAPDVIVMNSCLWDITRWGPDGIEKYKLNIISLIKLLRTSLPCSTKVIWITAPPISKEPKTGLLIKQIEFLKHTLRFDVMEANTFVSREFILNGFDLLDIHYHLLLQIHRRRRDGIHWDPEATRYITNLFLTHLCVSWNLPLPGNFKSPLLDELYENSFNFNSLRTEEILNSVVKHDILATSSFYQNNERGKKHDCNGQIIGESSCEIDFTKDIFDYDFTAKKFKILGESVY